MPGVNRTGLPTTQDLWIGKGALYFAPLDPTSYKPTHFRHLGNCPGFNLNLETEVLEHFSSRSGIKQQDREIILSQKIGLSLTLDYIADFDNLSLFLSGSVAKDQTNSARTVTTTNRLIHADAVKGREYELRDATELRLFDLHTSGLVVRSGGASPGTTLLVENTDYTVDYTWGTIFLLSTGAHSDGENLWFSYTPNGTQEKLIDVVNMLTQTKISGFLRYKGVNPANAGKKMMIDFHSVSLKAEGEMPLIGEDFSTMTLTGVAERNEIGFPTSPVGRVIWHPDA